MMKIKKGQIAILIVAVVAVVLLLLLPQTEEVSSEVEKLTQTTSVSDEYPANAVAGLSESDLVILNHLSDAIESSTDPLSKIELRDSLSHFWEDRGDLLMAADELFYIAEIIDDKASYLIAGDKYFLAFGEIEDDRKIIAIEKAIGAYEAVLYKHPKDLEAMTSLGVCYVEGSALIGEPPMKGIGLLRNVLEIDPKNINALINLGYFATKSGQYEKAAERFKQVIEIDSAFADAYLYLSDVYLQMGNNEEAASYLEEFLQFVEDPAKREQMKVYIENIRNNNI